MDITNYTFTKHASNRLAQRFLIGSMGRITFLRMFIDHGGKLYRQEEDGLQIWRNKEVEIVVNEKEKTIITCYPIKEIVEKEVMVEVEKQVDIYDDLKSDLKEQTRLLKKKIVRDNYDYISNKIDELSSISKSFKNTHDDVIDEKFDEFYQTIVYFRKKMGKIKAYRDSASKFMETQEWDILTLTAWNMNR